MEIASDFGERLKELREEKGLTQKQVAAKLGVRDTTISAYESNKKYPRVDKFMKLVQIFDTSADYLLGFKSEKIFDLSNISDHQRKLLTNIINSLIEEFRNPK